MTTRKQVWLSFPQFRPALSLEAILALKENAGLREEENTPFHSCVWANGKSLSAVFRSTVLALKY